MATLGLRFLSNNVTFGTKIGAGGKECGACKSLNLKALRRKYISSFVVFAKSINSKCRNTVEKASGEAPVVPVVEASDNYGP